MAWPTLMELVTSGRSAVRRISASVLRSMISFMQAVPAETIPIPASAQSSLMVSTGSPDLCCAEEEAAPGSDHDQRGHANLGELRVVAKHSSNSTGPRAGTASGWRGSGRHAPTACA